MVKTWSNDNPKAALMARKRKLIVAAATRAFLDKGYAESSVNRIAAVAGVSIKTLYRHFDSKDDLFIAVMQAACSNSGEDLMDASPSGVVEEPAWFIKPPEIALVIAGEEYLRHALSDDQLALYRVVTRDAHHFPSLGRLYHEQVVEQRDSLFMRYLDRWLPVVKWKVSDRREAAVVFAGLLKDGLFDDALHGGHIPNEREISKHAQNAAARMLILFEAGAV